LELQVSIWVAQSRYLLFDVLGITHSRTARPIRINISTHHGVKFGQQKALKHGLAALQRLREYVNRQMNLTNKGVKHDLASDAWRLHSVDIGGVTM